MTVNVISISHIVSVGPRPTVVAVTTVLASGSRESRTVGLGLTETILEMEMKLTVINLSDTVGLRSYTPLLDLMLAMVGQIKETMLKRDPKLLQDQETKAPRIQRAKKHPSLVVIRLRA